MARYKERPKRIHEPSTHEVFVCLASMIKWSQILLEHGPEKDYRAFLKLLIENRYFEDIEGKTTIKQVANEFNFKTAKVTKWIHEIYQDILQLNNDNEDLFIENKHRIIFSFRYFDNSGSIAIGLDAVPRVYEHFEMRFMKAKLGCDRFWVKMVQHEVHDTGIEIYIWLEGDTLNRYREMVFDEALFKGWIGFIEKWELTSYEIDDILMKYMKR